MPTYPSPVTQEHLELAEGLHDLAATAITSPCDIDIVTSKLIIAKAARLVEGAMQGKFLMCIDGDGNTTWTVPNFGGTHSQLQGLDYASAGHTGFETPTGAQSKVDTHAAITTGVHGVGESNVESTSGAQAKAEAEVSSHSGETTGVHGVGTSAIESVSGAQGKVDAHAALENAHHVKLHNHSDDEDGGGKFLAPKAISMTSLYSTEEDDVRLVTGNPVAENPFFISVHNLDGTTLAGLVRNVGGYADVSALIAADDGSVVGFVIVNTGEAEPRVVITKTDGLRLTDGTNAVCTVSPEGDIEIYNSARGLILHSATKLWRIKVDDDGVLATQEVI